jgi:hypothetical protein
MLVDLDHGLVVQVIDSLDEAFMLEAKSFGFCRWVDSPFVWRRALVDCSSVEEAGESLFENSSGCEGPDGGPLSLDRDLRGGIGEGLGKHVTVMRGVRTSGGVEVVLAGYGLSAQDSKREREVVQVGFPAVKSRGFRYM